MPDAISLNLIDGIRVASNTPIDADRFLRQNDSARDQLIQDQRAYEGMPIYHQADKKLYYLKDYPTPGNLTGVVWEEIGSGVGGVEFTQAEKDKLAALSDNYKQKHATGAALAVAHPAPASDSWAIVEDTDTVWVWDVDGSQWVDTGSSAPTITVQNNFDGGVNDALSAEKGKELNDRVELAFVGVAYSGNTLTFTRDDGSTAGTNIDFVPYVKAATNHSAPGVLTVNVLSHHIDAGRTLQADVTELELTSGTQIGKVYTLKIMQDGTGGHAFNFAADHELDYAYVAGDKRIFDDGVQAIVYECVTPHTSDLTDHFAQIGNWNKKYSFEGNKAPIMSLDPDKVDNLIITVQANGKFHIKPEYDVQF